MHKTLPSFINRLLNEVDLLQNDQYCSVVSPFWDYDLEDITIVRKVHAEYRSTFNFNVSYTGDFWIIDPWRLHISLPENSEMNPEV